MKPSEILGHLESLIENISVELRYEKGDFKGGLCRVNDQKILIVNSNLTDDEKIKVVATELNQLDLDNIYVLPAIREVIDEYAVETES
jgi:hypothetical protein